MYFYCGCSVYLVLKHIKMCKIATPSIDRFKNKTNVNDSNLQIIFDNIIYYIKKSK